MLTFIALVQCTTRTDSGVLHKLRKRDAETEVSRQKRDSCLQMMWLSENCNNHGTCNEDDVSAHCVCLDGWMGTYCSIPPATQVGGRPQEGTDGSSNPGNVNPCLSLPCNNGGICFRTNNRGVAPYICMCSSGFTGSQCESSNDVPADNTNDGVDRPLNGGGTVDSEASLRCHQLYSDSNRCNNSGHCVIDDMGAFCKCNSGWTGTYCQSATGAELPQPISDGNTNPCSSRPCKNDGTCFRTDANGAAPYTCLCTAGFTGQWCQNINAGNNDGNIIDNGDADEGLSADNCANDGDMRCHQLYAYSNHCSDRGCCSVDTIGTFCKCQPGWAGTNCQYQVSTMIGVLRNLQTFLEE